MSLSRVTVWSTGALLQATALNAEFDNVLAGIAAINTNAANSITASMLTNGANPEVFFAELFADGAVIGDSDFIYLSDTALTVTISGGTVYVLQTSSTPDKLVRIEVAASTTYTVLDNTTSYLDIGSDGVIDVVQSSVAATDHARLLEVVALGGVITGTTDLADREFLDDTIGAFKPKNTEWSVASASTILVEQNTRFRDTTNTRDFEFDTDQTIDITTTGANGLDQVSEGASKWYVVVGIGDPGGQLATKGLLVEEANYPGSIVLPEGYTLYGRIGYVRNDGSSNFISGRFHHDRFYFDDNQLLGNFTDTSFATKSAAAIIPPVCRNAFINSRYTGGGNSAMTWRETGSAAATGHQYYSINGGQGGNTYMLFDESQQVDLKIAAGTNDCYISHYLDDLQKGS
jgi:hypothetical protein